MIHSLKIVFLSLIISLGLFGNGYAMSGKAPTIPTSFFDGFPHDPIFGIAELFSVHLQTKLYGNIPLLFGPIYQLIQQTLQEEKINPDSVIIFKMHDQAKLSEPLCVKYTNKCLFINVDEFNMQDAKTKQFLIKQAVYHLKNGTWNKRKAIVGGVGIFSMWISQKLTSYFYDKAKEYTPESMIPSNSWAKYISEKAGYVVIGSCVGTGVNAFKRRTIHYYDDSTHIPVDLATLGAVAGIQAAVSFNSLTRTVNAGTVSNTSQKRTLQTNITNAIASLNEHRQLDPSGLNERRSGALLEWHNSLCNNYNEKIND